MPDPNLPVIRKAVQADAPGIARVHIDSWQTTYRGIVPDEHLAKLSYEEREDLWIRAVTDPEQINYVEEVAERIVGFANRGKNRGDETEY